MQKHYDVIRRNNADFFHLRFCVARFSYLLFEKTEKPGFSAVLFVFRAQEFLDEILLRHKETGIVEYPGSWGWHIAPGRLLTSTERAYTSGGLYFITF